jgi:hypothetical protein
LTDEQRAAVSASLLLDPDTVASLGDGELRLILGGLADAGLTPSLDQEAGDAAREEARRFLDEIM